MRKRCPKEGEALWHEEEGVRWYNPYHKQLRWQWTELRLSQCFLGDKWKFCFQKPPSDGLFLSEIFFLNSLGDWQK